MDTITTIQDYGSREGQVGSRLDTTPVPPPPVQDQILLDLETDTLLTKSKKLNEKKKAISLEVTKKKFKFKTRGKLEKAEIAELRRTHKKNIFRWVKEEKNRILEMDNFEEITNSVDMDIQIEIKKSEADIYKEDRLNRVKARQKEFWTRRLGKEIMDDVLSRVMLYRPIQGADGQQADDGGYSRRANG